MKKLGIVALALVMVIVIFGVLALATGAFTRGWSFFRFSHNLETVNQSETIELNEATKIIIHAVDAEITVLPEADNSSKTITSKLTGQISADRDIKLEVTTSADGKTITISTEYDKDFFKFGTFSRDLKLKVNVPVVYTGNLNIVNVSGKVIADMNAFNTMGNVDVITTSGKIEITNLKANELTAKSVSGAVDVTDSQITDGITATTTSGYVEVVNSNAKQVDARSVSGKISVAGNIEQWVLKTTSGSINAEPVVSPKGLDIDSVSGRADVKLPEDARFDGDFDSVSGNVRNEFGDITPNDGEVLPVYSIDTTSGAISVTK